VLLKHPTSLEETVTLQKAGGTGKSVRILVVDDYEPWRRFASTTLREQPELEVVGQVSDGLEAVQKAQQLQPDLILLDIGLPTLNGIEAARRIRVVSPTSKILFVSENRSPDIAEEALSTGAGGYVVKSDAGSELLPAVKAVLEGKRFISASLAGHFLVATTLSTTQTMLSWMVMLISGIR
jgi:DNA-binding NarL/FixJ family response regulator